MSASPTEQTLPTGALKGTIISAVLVGALVFSLNARGTILESMQTIQAFALDRYKVQWITGLEGVAGLTSLFASIYLIKVCGSSARLPSGHRSASPPARWANPWRGHPWSWA